MVLYENYNTLDALQLLQQMSFFEITFLHRLGVCGKPISTFAPSLLCMLKSSLKHSSLEMSHFVNVFLLCSEYNF